MTGSLFVSDIHWHHDPREAYRFKLGDWVVKVTARNGVRQIVVFGDLTAEKDNHPASLVNWIVDTIRQWAEKCEVYIVMGNHDYEVLGSPFFKFLNHLERVYFVWKPYSTELNIDGATDAKARPVLLLPHTRQYEVDWRNIDFTHYDWIFCHQTFEGVRGENGHALPGIPTSVFGSTKARIYSGDIHVPQKIGPVTYVGAPYRQKFGDNFTPRCLLLKNRQQTALHVPVPSKHVIYIRSAKWLTDARVMQRAGVEHGDMLKVMVQIGRDDFARWPEIREEVLQAGEKAGFDLRSVEPAPETKQEPSRKGRRRLESDPKKLVNDYGQREGVDDKTIETGLSIVEKEG